VEQSGNVLPQSKQKSGVTCHRSPFHNHQTPRARRRFRRQFFTDIGTVLTNTSRLVKFEIDAIIETV